MVREPAVAGRFYPSDPVELSALIREYVAPTDATGSSVRVKACLVPHAGYIYSGPVAGAVFGESISPQKLLFWVYGIGRLVRPRQLCLMDRGKRRSVKCRSIQR